MIIRPATSADLPILNQISYQAKQSWGYPQAWMEHWKADLTLRKENLESWAVWLAEVKHQPIGFCALSESPESFELEHLWVTPEQMGKGYGRKLLMHSLNQIQPANKPVLVLADPHAEAFYKKLGFKTFSKRESYPPGRFLPLMKKLV